MIYELVPLFKSIHKYCTNDTHIQIIIDQVLIFLNLFILQNANRQCKKSMSNIIKGYLHSYAGKKEFQQDILRLHLLANVNGNY